MGERHDAVISGSGRIGWRASCYCGWSSSPYTGITGAELAYGEHLAAEVPLTLKRRTRPDPHPPHDGRGMSEESAQ